MAEMIVIKGSKNQLLCERIVIAVIFIAYLVLQANAIIHGNYAGQDYARHKLNILSSSKSPLEALTAPLTYAIFTTPTLYHFIVARIYNILPDCNKWQVIAFFNLATNSLALIIYYLICRRFIASLLLRLGNFIFVAFLPVAVITAVVIGSDSIMTLCSVSIVYILIRIAEKSELKQPVTLEALALCIVLCLSFMCKFPYVLSLFGVSITFLILYYLKLLRGSSFWKSAALAIIIPSLVFIVLYTSYLQYQTTFYRDKAIYHVTKNKMNYRSLVFFRSNDVHLLSAPYFHEVFAIDGALAPYLHLDNYFSYPALLHLGIFTDVLNMYEPIRYRSDDPRVKDEYYSRVRTGENKLKMIAAVVIALPFSFFAVIASARVLLLQFIMILKRKVPPDKAVLILLLVTLPIFMGVMTALPKTNYTYGQGFWLPRLLMPQLIVFFTMLFYWFDKLRMRLPAYVPAIVFAITLLQAMLNWSFLFVTN